MLSSLVSASLAAQNRPRAPSADSGVVEVRAERFSPAQLDPTLILRGRVAGLRVFPSGAVPMGSAQVSIEGSAATGLVPLVLIDGMVAPAGLRGLDAADVERVEVLRGAAAAAFYGSRAGGGVINVITRRGHPGPRLLVGARTEISTADVARDFNPAASTTLLENPAGRFCVQGPGPLCSQTIDWNTELARINNDSTALPAALVGDPTGTPLSPTQLANLYQANPMPAARRSPVRQLLRSSVLDHESVDLSARAGGTALYGVITRLGMPSLLRETSDQGSVSGLVALRRQFGRRFTASLRGFVGRSSGDSSAPANALFLGTLLPITADLSATDSLGRLYRRLSLYAIGGQLTNPALLLPELPFGGHSNRTDLAGTVTWTPMEWLVAEARGSFERLRSNFGQSSALTFPSGGLRTENVDGATTGAGYELSVIASRRVLGLRTRSTVRLFGEHDRLQASDSLGFPGASSFTWFVSEFADFDVLGGTSVDIGSRIVADGLLRRDSRAYAGDGSRSRSSSRVALAWRPLGPALPTPGSRFSLTLRAARGSIGVIPNPPLAALLNGAGFQLGQPEKSDQTELGADVAGPRGSRLMLTWSAATDRHLQTSVPAGFGTPGPALADVGDIASRTWELALVVPLVRRPGVDWSVQLGFDRTRSEFSTLRIAPVMYGGTQTNPLYLAATGVPVGAIYGRTFATSCSQLPASVQSSCGDGREFQRNDDGFIVWVGDDAAGHAFSWRDGITHNLWGQSLPSAQAPWGVPLNWGAPIVVRDSSCVAAPSPQCTALESRLGIATPQEQLSIGTTVRWGRLSVYGMLQGILGRSVWNEARQFALIDGVGSAADQQSRTPETAKPFGYYWRAAPPDNIGYGGLYDVLAPNNFSVEKADFLKLRELSVSWDVGRVGLARWSVTIVGRNLLTLTSYHGLDPDLPAFDTAGQVLGIDAISFPDARTLGVSLGARF